MLDSALMLQWPFFTHVFSVFHGVALLSGGPLFLSSKALAVPPPGSIHISNLLTFIERLKAGWAVYGLARSSPRSQGLQWRWETSSALQPGSREFYLCLSRVVRRMGGNGSVRVLPRTQAGSFWPAVRKYCLLLP